MSGWGDRFRPVCASDSAIWPGTNLEASPASLAVTCTDAVDALLVGSLYYLDQNSSVLDIADHRTEQAVAKLLSARQRLVAGALGDLPDRSDGPVLQQTIVAWCASGFSLVDAAEALTIHHNTMLYRLGKIEQILGRPWRDHQTMLGTYIACLATTSVA